MKAFILEYLNDNNMVTKSMVINAANEADAVNLADSIYFDQFGTYEGMHYTLVLQPQAYFIKK
jgi:hypothetical protein